MIAVLSRRTNEWHTQSRRLSFRQAQLPSVRLDTLTDFQVTRVDAMDLDS